MADKKRIAVFDPKAFYPFSSLVKGPLSSLDELESIEELIRATVLHDEMVMEVEPFAFDGMGQEWTPSEIEAGGRTVITSVAPVLDEYQVFTQELGPRRVPNIELSPALHELASNFSNAEPGNVYYEAHIDFLKRLVEVLQSGGSVVCKGPFAREAFETASAFPEKLFQTLDADWQEFGHRVNEGKLSLSVPPFLAIVLTRSANREAIPRIVGDLREEWAVARSKVWDLVDRLKTAGTLAEANEIDRELAEASRHFSPARKELWSSPLRILWELFVAGISGATIAGVAGGDVRIGAATGLISQAARTVQTHADIGRALFGRGAFDLARRVRRETARVEMHALENVLSDAEREALGL